MPGGVWTYTMAPAGTAPTDPCADVTCADGQSCADGACVDDCSTSGVVFSGAFGGTSVDCDTYTNPTGSEGWAGFANEDASLYPLSFPSGGELSFTGATDGTDVDVYFRFEYNPYPDTEPSFNTAAVTVSGAAASYSVDIPAQGANTYSSFLLYVTTADAPVTLTDVAVSDVVCGTGDLNDDGNQNVLDVVAAVGHILGNTVLSDAQVCAVDMNTDGILNVLDIVNLVGLILEGREVSATNVEIIKTIHAVHMNADGFVGAVQMTLNHSEDFELNLTNNAFVADYNTVGNSTTLMVVSPEGSELFTAHGAFTIESVVAASADSYLNTEISVPAEISIGNAYPNPFNPSTTLSVELNTETYVSMNVFNVMGQLVEVIAEGNMNAGTHVITWDASQLSSGIYLVNTVVGNSMHQQKVMLLK